MVEKLDYWKDLGEFIWNDRIVQILYFVPYTGASGNDFEVYFKDGSSLITDAVRLEKVMNEWHPIHQQAVLLAKGNERKVSTLSFDVINDLRDAVLTQIKALKENPSEKVIAQTKAINESIGAIANLARTELEFRKLIFKIKNEE